MKLYIASALTAFALSCAFCPLLIAVLRKMGAGQNILVYVKEHSKKSGTPTMGGIAFIAATIFSAALFIPQAKTEIILTIVIGLFYMIIGIMDDLLKKKHKKNLGLKAWQKLFFQVLVAIFAGVYCLRADTTTLYLPFFCASVDIGFWILPLSVFVFVATVNAVNLTDGLDGLAAGVSVPFFLFIGILIALQKGENGFSVLAFSLVGALLAYLLFNISPASVFMGDTGSLALGGFAASIGIFTGNALYIAVIGLPFVFSVVSVIIQVAYYKATGGKRIFLMSPIHHHFQEKGYSESKISYAYFLVSCVLGAVCVLTVV